MSVKCDMRKLYKVTAGPYASVPRYERTYVTIYEFSEQAHKIRMNSAFALEEGAEPRYHGGLDKHVRQRLTGSAGMAPDYIVLKIRQVFVIHPPLCHGAEARIDPVYDFISRKFFQETEARSDFLNRKLGQVYFIAVI